MGFWFPNPRKNKNGETASQSASVHDASLSAPNMSFRKGMKIFFVTGNERKLEEVRQILEMVTKMSD